MDEKKDAKLEVEYVDLTQLPPQITTTSVSTGKKWIEELYDNPAPKPRRNVRGSFGKEV